MERLNRRIWRLRWVPDWVKTNVFPTHWTQAEVDSINARATGRAAEFARYVN